MLLLCVQKSANGACVAVTDRRRALVWPAKLQQDSLVRPLVVKHTKNLTVRIHRVLVWWRVSQALL